MPFAQENKHYVNGSGQRSISWCAANTPNDLLLNILIQNEAWLWIIEFVTSMRWGDVITVGLEPNSLLRWKSPSGQNWEISVLLLVHVLYWAKLRARSNVVAQKQGTFGWCDGCNIALWQGVVITKVQMKNVKKPYKFNRMILNVLFCSHCLVLCFCILGYNSITANDMDRIKCFGVF